MPEVVAGLRPEPQRLVDPVTFPEVFERVGEAFLMRQQQADGGVRVGRLRGVADLFRELELLVEGFERGLVVPHLLVGVAEQEQGL